MRVAIKVIRDGPTDEHLLQRFLSEQQILSNLLLRGVLVCVARWYF
jgi:hypothetical protein